MIGDGRSGEPLPLQVIIVLAAAAGRLDRQPGGVKIATETQQLDLDALTRVGIDLGIKYRYVNALNAVSATVRPDQMAQLRAAPRGRRGLSRCARLYPARRWRSRT